MVLGKSIIKATALSLVALMVSACGTMTMPDGTATVEDQGFSVKASTPRTGELEVFTSYMGTFEPKELVSVIAMAQTEVTDIYVTLGQEVKEGEILALQNDESAQDAVEIARLQYELAQAQVDQQMGSSYEQQMNQLDSSYDKAHESYETMQDDIEDTEDAIADAQKAIPELTMEIAQAGFVLSFDEDGEFVLTPVSASNATPSQSVIEKAQEVEELQNSLPALMVALVQLEGSLEFARDGYTNAKDAYQTYAVDGRSELERLVALQLQSAEKAYEAQKKQLDMVQMEAPISGTVEQINISVNNYPSPQSAAFVIVNDDAMTIEMGVSATVANNIAVGDNVDVELYGDIVQGSVIEIAGIPNMQTGLIPVSVSVDLAGKEVTVGQRAKVTLASEKVDNGMIIPQDAVYYDDGAAYVYIEVDGIAVQTYVETGVSTPEEIEITGGILATDNVITTWHPNLVDGAKVIIAS